MRFATWLGEKLVGDTPVEIQLGSVQAFVVDEGMFIARLLKAMGKAAITLGETVIFREGFYTPSRMRHELVHVDQWRHYGIWFFLLYPLRVSKFEKEAEAAE